MIIDYRTKIVINTIAIRKVVEVNSTGSAVPLLTVYYVSIASGVAAIANIGINVQIGINRLTNVPGMSHSVI